MNKEELMGLTYSMPPDAEGIRIGGKIGMERLWFDTSYNVADDDESPWELAKDQRYFKRHGRAQYVSKRGWKHPALESADK